jgi:hypothetical protein
MVERGSVGGVVSVSVRHIDSLIQVMCCALSEVGGTRVSNIIVFEKWTADRRLFACTHV